EVDFYMHMDNYIKRLRQSDRESYANTFEQTKDRLKEFSLKDNLGFNEVNYRFLEDFRSFFLAKKMSENSIALHTRNIRTIFNDAINSDIVGLEYYPFRKYKIRKKQSNHRNLSLKELNKIMKYEPVNKTEERIKDLIFLSFYLIGVNFKDLMLAKKDQVYKGRFHYDRFKTKKPYSIKVLPEAHEIIEKYEGEGEYLLRFMEDKIKNNKKIDRKTPLYKDITDQTNKVMKRILENCKLGKRGSTYFMRHSWASIADELEIPRTVIKLAMGHGNDSVTDVYINTDLKRVDEANKKVIEYLHKSLKNG
ncbi:MAG: tyrosine-type recombinase/integrase, partial [Bacteroidales bacterium]